MTYYYKYGGDAENECLYSEVLGWIEQSEVLELDKCEKHYPMRHVITPPAIIEAQGWAQMEVFIPVKLKGKN